MNKKQLIVAWVMVVVIALLIGLQLVHLRLLDDQITFEDGSRLSVNKFYSVNLYGFDIGKGDYDNTKYISALVKIQENKYRLIAPILLIGGLLIYTLRDKKK